MFIVAIYHLQWLQIIALIGGEFYVSFTRIPQEDNLKTKKKKPLGGLLFMIIYSNFSPVWVLNTSK